MLYADKYAVLNSPRNKATSMTVACVHLCSPGTLDRDQYISDLGGLIEN